MAMQFTAIARGTNGNFEFTEEFVRDFMAAWSHLSENPDHLLQHEFVSASAREEWLEMAKAYGRTVKPEPIEIRRIKRTGSSDPSTGHLTFVMETKATADARRARLRLEAADREKRRQNGEELRPGKRRYAA